MVQGEQSLHDSNHSDCHRFLRIFFAAAAFILARCVSENPPELVEQSRFGFALQRGQTKEIGLTGRMSAMGSASFAISKVYAERGSHRFPAENQTAPLPGSRFPRNTNIRHVQTEAWRRFVRGRRLSFSSVHGWCICRGWREGKSLWVRLEPIVAALLCFLVLCGLVRYGDALVHWFRR
jgi:hypothetical protein